MALQARVCPRLLRAVFAMFRLLLAACQCCFINGPELAVLHFSDYLFQCSYRLLIPYCSNRIGRLWGKLDEDAAGAREVIVENLWLDLPRRGCIEKTGAGHFMMLSRVVSDLIQNDCSLVRAGTRHCLSSLRETSDFSESAALASSRTLIFHF